MLAFQGPAQPSPTLGDALNGGYKKTVLGTTRARVAVEAAVELGWERCIGLEGRFVGMHSFGASGKIADVYKKFDQRRRGGASRT